MSTLPKNLVVFCGAGFSVGAGVPTMNNFLHTLRHSKFLSPEEQRELDTVVLTCQSLASVIGEHAGNAEQLCSFLSLLKVIRPDYEFQGNNIIRTPEHAELLMRRCIASTFGKPDLKSESCNDVWGIVSLTEQLGARVAFVTTNYDAHIELGCARHRVAMRSDLADVKTVSTEYSRASRRVWHPFTRESFGRNGYAESNWRVKPYNNREVSLCKLHGSITWKKENNSIFILNDYIISTTAEESHKIDSYPQIDAVLNIDSRSWCRDDSLVLVPPTVLKANRLGADATDAEAVLLSRQWREAARELREADAVWFIGYSFPESDSFMRFFLVASLFDNPRLRQLVVIDPDRRAIEERAKPLFASPALRHLFVGLPVGWESVRLPALLRGNITEALRGATDTIEDRRRVEEFVVFGDRDV